MQLHQNLHILNNQSYGENIFIYDLQLNSFLIYNMTIKKKGTARGRERLGMSIE